MRHKQQARVAHQRVQALEVEGGDDGLAGAGGGDHEVLEVVVAFAFGGKRCQSCRSGMRILLMLQDLYQPVKMFSTAQMG